MITTIDTFSTAIEVLVAQLADLGRPVSDEDCLATFACGLPPELEVTRSYIELTPSITYEEAVILANAWSSKSDGL